MTEIRIVRGTLPARRNETTLYFNVSDGRFARGLAVVDTAKQVRMFVLAIVSHEFVTQDTMTEILWGGDSDGGPEQLATTYNSLACIAKAVLTALGFRFETWYGVGWRVYDCRKNL